VLGLLAALMCTHRFVWGGGVSSKSKLSQHEADYYRSREEAGKE
jgi:hypothetical protein